ncbi:MAG: winged helix-turn-helix domain-containing protein, partial [Sphingomonadaceae bacterium]|nr:winged helix-turn-helix domain-containing protein [Sphingomonadaceae bacterium]
MTVVTASPGDQKRRPIDLASHPRFRVGKLEVRPGVREVVGVDGPELVEPRVMAVLIALADAAGETLSRDELIERCWGGVVVGEDAINRVIAKLRRLAAGAGAGSFAIETVTKVGHRLILCDAAGLAAARPPPADGIERPRRKAVALASILALTAAALLAWRLAAPSVEQPVDPTANELVERGLSSVFDGTPEQAAQSVAYLREATALSPSSARAWGALAFAYAIYIRRVPPVEQAAVIERARSAAHRALRLDKRQPEALAALAELPISYRNWDAKDAAQRRALAVAPDDDVLLYQRAR